MWTSRRLAAFFQVWHRLIRNLVAPHTAALTTSAVTQVCIHRKANRTSGTAHKTPEVCLQVQQRGWSWTCVLFTWFSLWLTAGVWHHGLLADKRYCIKKKNEKNWRARCKDRKTIYYFKERTELNFTPLYVCVCVCVYVWDNIKQINVT